MLITEQGYGSCRFGILRQQHNHQGLWVRSLGGSLATGRYRETFEDGSVEQERYYVMGLENGWRKTWWPGGGARRQVFFRDGLAHGQTKSWHFNGRLASQGKYVRGQIAGEIMRWSEDGERLESNILGSKASTQGNDLNFLKQSSREEGLWIDQRSNQPAHGIFVRRFDTLDVEEEVRFVDGREEGLRCVWWPNGRIRRKQGLKKGLGSGVTRSWHFNGQIARRGSMRSGGFVGAYETWLPNGQLTWQRYQDEKGDRVGYERMWNDDGELIYLAYYHSNILLWETYDFEQSH